MLSADLLWFTWRLLLVATAEILWRVWFLALVIVRLRATYLSGKFSVMMCAAIIQSEAALTVDFKNVAVFYAAHQ
ncbi:hypothetical protein [Anaplasma phagocytophilum]|nr:hypothetical protein [Anaplasma phagocytophilum]ABD43660.1 hypothetical protein APH_0099 [Anaplasma phagocytophilum str. HZ]AGR80436.1 hypothetical protein WSQ_00485 [Anaplasma phagocytophilum str. JM]AGR81691.1 hypothetical protein YYY_00490 [Anaplasma phagocytophilum str. Dog2]KJV83514.1 hypothetical protein APHHGE2_0323 [Anaplasma phagocytophilum str. HGE2]KJV84771.1 hypothetical protein APHWI1_1098 [Anaplasma phagocytophilum str. ApWI1]